MQALFQTKKALRVAGELKEEMKVLNHHGQFAEPEIVINFLDHIIKALEESESVLSEHYKEK